MKTSNNIHELARELGIERKRWTHQGRLLGGTAPSCLLVLQAKPSMIQIGRQKQR